ncbi:MAG: helix-turn-helix domain-containing protein [Pseudonocardiaceae bacterium]
MTDGPWVSDLVAARIRQLRIKRGFLTTEALAQRCAEIGATKLTAAVLMNIESGRRGPDGRRRRTVDVDELLALSHALNVSPLSLLLPADGSSEYRLTSNIAVRAVKVGRWLLGLRPLHPEPTPSSDLTPHPGVTAAYESAFHAELPTYLSQQLEPEELIRWLEGAAHLLKTHLTGFAGGGIHSE